MSQCRGGLGVFRGSGGIWAGENGFDHFYRPKKGVKSLKKGFSSSSQLKGKKINDPPMGRGPSPAPGWEGAEGPPGGSGPPSDPELCLGPSRLSTNPIPKALLGIFSLLVKHRAHIEPFYSLGFSPS